MPNEREQAILIWISVLLVVGLFMPSTRKNLGACIKAAMAYQIVIAVATMIFYILCIISSLKWLNLWSSAQVTTTVFWTISAAFVSIIRLNSITENENYFRETLRDQFRLVMVFEFLINVNVFSLPVELIFIPLTVFLGGLLAVAELNIEYKQVKVLLDWLLVFLGLTLLILSVYYILSHFSSFATMKTLKEFIVTPIMSIVFMPFLYFFGLFASYEKLFARLRFFVKDDSLVQFTKVRTLMAFHIRLGRLNRWAKHINRLHLKSKDEVRTAIKEFNASIYAQDEQV